MPLPRMHAEVVAPRIVQAVAARCHVEPGKRRDAVGIEPRGVHDQAGLDDGRLTRAPGGDAIPVAGLLCAHYLVPPCRRAAMRLGVRQQAGHELVRVHDPRVGGPQAAHRPDVRLEGADLGGRQRAERGHTVGLGLPDDLVELGFLVGRSGND